MAPLGRAPAPEPGSQARVRMQQEKGQEQLGKAEIGGLFFSDREGCPVSMRNPDIAAAFFSGAVKVADVLTQCAHHPSK